MSRAAEETAIWRSSWALSPASVSAFWLEAVVSDGFEELAGGGEQDLRVAPGGALVVPLPAPGLMGSKHLGDDGGGGAGVGGADVGVGGPGVVLGVAAGDEMGIDVGEAPDGRDGPGGLLAELVGGAGEVVPDAGEVGDLAEQGISRGGHSVELIPRQPDGFDQLLDGGDVDDGPGGPPDADEHESGEQGQPEAAFPPWGVLRVHGTGG